MTVQFGLYDVVDGERRLCGVAVFGVPVSTAALTKPLPELRPYTESLVCSRFILLDAWRVVSVAGWIVIGDVLT
ncbi:hypothetical protein OHU34_43690 (plasmid) [Streptomyces sp. NBC_00080]|uniref:hypothetical protein n=1 Tax=Streptomyces sp. NBC_00080 TaxID=2975645 RepID=UPI0032482F92